MNSLTILPGVGEKTAERFVYSIYNNDIQETYINKVSDSDVSAVPNFTNGIKVQGYLLTIG